MTPEAKAYCEAQAKRIAEIEAENTNLKFRLGVMIETEKQGSEHRSELQQQRDELLAALENVADNVCDRLIERGPVIEGVNFHALQVGLRAAIAKVKQ